MTVKELIIELLSYDMDDQVVVKNETHGSSPFMQITGSSERFSPEPYKPYVVQLNTKAFEA